MDIPYILPEKPRLHHDYYMRCLSAGSRLDQFCASQQTQKGSSGNEAASSCEELLGCVPSSREEKHGQNRRESTGTFPLDTLEEPLAQNRFTAVSGFSAEPAETPRMKSAECNQEEESFSLMPLPALRGPSLIASAAIDSLDPQPAGQRRGTNPPNSASSPHAVQRTTIPSQTSQQEEWCHEKTAKEDPEEIQESAQKDGKQRKQKNEDEGLRRQRAHPAKQGQRERMRQRQLEQQQPTESQGIEQQGNRHEHQEEMHQVGPSDMHGQHTDSSHHEDGERKNLNMHEDNASTGGEVGGTALQQEQHQMHALDGSGSSCTANRLLQRAQFGGHCKEPAKETQTRTSCQHPEKEGEQQLLPLQHMPAEWLQHEMQALLREEYQQRQIVQRREEQQHEALQQHPPLERPWVLLAQKQQEEDLRQMHQASLRQMQQELADRHQRHIQARLQEETKAQQEKLEKERQETIRLKQQQKQNHQKQLKIHQPASGAKPRSTPLTRRKNIYWQHRQEEKQRDNPVEVQTTAEQEQEQLSEKQPQQQKQQEEEQPTQSEEQPAKQAQPHPPAEQKGENSGNPSKEGEQQPLQQQGEPVQRRKETDETEGVKPNPRKNNKESLQKQQQPTQSQQHEQQLKQHQQQQHDVPTQEEVRQSLQLGEQKAQQALQKGRKPAYLQKWHQKQQPPTKQEGHQRQHSKGKRERTNSRQPTAGEGQQEPDDPKQREDQAERNEKYRQKQKQQSPCQDEEQTQERFMGRLEVPLQHGEKQLPTNEAHKQKLTQHESRQSQRRECLEEERLPEAQQQPLSTEQQTTEQQQEQDGVRELKKNKGQTQEENQRMRVQQYKEQPKQRWLQQKEPQHPLPKGSQTQTQVKRREQQPQQKQKGEQQEQQQQDDEQQHEVHQQKDHRLEQQGHNQVQQQPPNKQAEGNSALTRNELLRLSFTPLAAVKDDEYYLQHRQPSNTNSSLPWGTTASKQQQPFSRMPLPDTPDQLPVRTPRRSLCEGQRSEDASAKVPVLPFQQADVRRFSKGQQRPLNQRWQPPEISQQQTADSKQAERGGPAKSLLRRRNPILLPPPPPPPPPVTAIMQLTQHSQEQWKTASMRGGHQPKNPRSRQRLLHQEQRRLQKQPKQSAANLPLRAAENFTIHQRPQQNIQPHDAMLQQDLQQHQRLLAYDQQVQRDIAIPVLSKMGDKPSSRSSHSSTVGVDSPFPFAQASRPTWDQDHISMPLSRECHNTRDHCTDEAPRSFVETEGGGGRADLDRSDNEQASNGGLDRQARRFGDSGLGLTQQLPALQARTLRSERKVQRLQEQAVEQQQKDRLNPIVQQVHQQLVQARLEFLEEQARGQGRSSTVLSAKKTKQQETQQQRTFEQAERKQGEERHNILEHQQQQRRQQHRQQQQQGQDEDSTPCPNALHRQQQLMSAHGHQQQQEQQQRREQQQQQEQQQQREQQQEQQQQQQQQQQQGQQPQQEQQQPQQRGHAQQKRQQDSQILYSSKDDIPQLRLIQAPSQEQHDPHEQQMQQGMELPHDSGEHILTVERQYFQRQDTCGQNRTGQPQQPLDVQHQQQAWLQRHLQQEQQYRQEGLHLTQGQQPQQHHQHTPQQPIICGRQYVALPQHSYAVMHQLHPFIEQQQQQAWLQLQLHLSLQQQQHACILMNQQRLWLLRQQHPWTPSQQHLWALQQHQFWQQQQQLWQLQQPQAWLQQQQHLRLQHQQQAYIQQHLRHEQQQQHGPPPAEHRADYCSPYAPFHAPADTVLGATENAPYIRHLVSCGMRMPPPWDGCISPQSAHLGFCGACLQYVYLDRYLLPATETALASSTAVVAGNEATSGYFYGPGSHEAREFLPHEQQLPTASADAAGGPPGVRILPATEGGGAAGATEMQGDTYQHMDANTVFINTNSHSSHNAHNSNSLNDNGGTYNESPPSNNSKGSVYNSSRSSSTAQRCRQMNRTSWGEGESSNNNNGNSSMASRFARFEAFEPFEFLTESPRGSSGQADSIVSPAAPANKAASILQATTTGVYQDYLPQPLQSQLHEVTPPLGDLLVGANAVSSHRSLSTFSSFNASAPVFVPARIAEPTSPTFAAAVAAAAAAANQESLASSTVGNLALDIRPWGSQQTNTQMLMNSYGQIHPRALQQQQQIQQQLSVHLNQDERREQQRMLRVQLRQANSQSSFDREPNAQQTQQSSQSLHQFPPCHQLSEPQQHQQQQNVQQQDEQQRNEQQLPNQPHAQPQQQWPQCPLSSFISGSLPALVSSIDSSSRQGSLLVIGACLQCWQFVVRPPALCLLDQIRERGIGRRITI
ncbi:hypothetical protein, conserved [Eimeria praecox]|uniref:Uncharacterized protein n=1 Tax=Eimeria praecox TaxID=51316 RepID=U6H902_9EIME|nr:hypothetical protein, conserved [Eimeria praecox]